VYEPSRNGYPRLGNYLLKCFPNETIKSGDYATIPNTTIRFLRPLQQMYWTANGITVLYFKEMRPYPMLSFAVRQFRFVKVGSWSLLSHNLKNTTVTKPIGKMVAALVRNLMIKNHHWSSKNHLLRSGKFEKEIPAFSVTSKKIWTRFFWNLVKGLSLSPQAIQAAKECPIGLLAKFMVHLVKWSAAALKAFGIY